MRVVTVSSAAVFHLQNTFKHNDYQKYHITLVGDQVSKLRSIFPELELIDLKIPRQISLINDFMALIQLIKLIRQTRPDIIHSIMPKAGLISALAGWIARVPIRIHTFTGQTWTHLSNPMRFLLIMCDRLIVKLSSICLTDSPSQSHFLLEHGIHNKRQPLSVLGKGSLTGVDLKKYDYAMLSKKRSAFRQELSIDSTGFIFVFLGRKCRDKGIYELVSAFKELNKEVKNIWLLLVGPDETESDIDRFVAAHPHIIIIPSTQEPEKYFALADVFCLPSYREGFGSTVIEAGALGLPTIGTTIPGLTDSVSDQVTGLLVPPQNISALVQAMRRIHDDKALYQKLSSNALHNVVSNYDSQHLHNLLYSLYAKLLKQKNH